MGALPSTQQRADALGPPDVKPRAGEQIRVQRQREEWHLRSMQIPARTQARQSPADPKDGASLAGVFSGEQPSDRSQVKRAKRC